MHPGILPFLSLGNGILLHKDEQTTYVVDTLLHCTFIWSQQTQLIIDGRFKECIDSKCLASNLIWNCVLSKKIQGLFLSYMPCKNRKCFKSKSSGSRHSCTILDEEIISLLPPCGLKWQQNCDKNLQPHWEKPWGFDTTHIIFNSNLNLYFMHAFMI